MFTLIKQTELYAPTYIGKKDVLLTGERIVKIDDDITITGVDVSIVDGRNTYCVPGLIDRHVHITGGGGEGGFSTSTPEVQLSSLVQNGITTVVGLLGTNDLARSAKSLLAKAKSLKEEGMNAYALTGGYGYPPTTITGEIRDDILFIDEVLGLKLAIEDHRSSYVTTEELKRMAAHVRVASMLAKKPGFIHLHMGNGKGLYESIYQVLEETDLPIQLFSPTHINRNERLLEASVEFAKRGGLIDVTSNINLVKENEVYTPAKAISYLLERGVDLNKITVSSDANGSLPVFNEEGQLTGLGVAGFEPNIETLKELVHQEGLPLEKALLPFTVNPAKGLGLYPNRGQLHEKAYADLVLLDSEFAIRDVFINGTAFMQNGQLLRKGTFEHSMVVQSLI
ncbi:beta-aspartyl-peptidase [Metabacillus iocasae]|uniref:Isoaspartyl dipeptidase n=1 Tax=Priestia iocasae TaxID=2291674 RepID=A0ABS2QVE4_9BACI|nr:beta-aspartyl-peptidase [Metabacillus iocasae]MBM7703464.1 beta-aspartyl-dipeptidase (metallo-type) [Metabacillus iocasae]